MKKLLVIVLASGLAFACGGEDEKKSEEWDVCKCHVEMDKIDQEMKENGGSEELMSKAQNIMGKCDKIQDEMGMDDFMAKKDECLSK